MTSSAQRGSTTEASQVCWGILATLGLLLLGLGFLEFVTTWFPLAIGNAEWEFGTVSDFLDGLPLLGLGLALTMSGGLGRGRRWVVRVAAGLLFLLAVIILLALVLWGTNVPLAFNAMRQPDQLTTLKKAITKSVVEGLFYPIGFIWMAVAGLLRGAKLSPRRG